MRLRASRNVFRRACHQNVAAVGASFRPEVNNVISTADHVWIVLDDENRVTIIDELVEGCDQQDDVVQMEACGGLVQDEKRPSFGALNKPLGELDALGLAAGKPIERLTQP